MKLTTSVAFAAIYFTTSLLATTPAWAALELSTGNGFLSACGKAEEEKDYFAQGLCYGFMKGVIERDAILMRPLRRICIPDSATNRQNMDIVLAYVRGHPQTRHVQTIILMSVAFNEAFPCQD